MSYVIACMHTVQGMLNFTPISVKIREGTPDKTCQQKFVTQNDTDQPVAEKDKSS